MNKRQLVLRAANLFFFLSLSVLVLAQGRYEVFESHQKFGVKDAEGKVVLKPKYEKLGWSQGVALPVGDVIGYYQDAWGILSLKGKRISHPRYYTLEAVHRDLILASQRGRFSNELLYGAVNAKGETVIDFKYHSIKRVKDLLIVSERVEGRSVFGILNEVNQMLLPLKYKAISPFFGDLFVFESFQGRNGIVSRNGITLIPAELDSIGSWNGRGFVVHQSGRVGLIDSAASYVIKPLHKTLNDELNTTSFASIELRTNSDVLLELKADSVSTTDNGFVLIYRNGFVEIVNEKGEAITQYDKIINVSPYRENLVVTTVDGVEVFNLQGEHWPGNTFDDVKLDEHFLYARSRDGWYVYNAFGRRITHRPFEDILPGSNNLIPVKKKGYWGYLDHTGQTAISFRFEKASGFQGQLAAVEYVGYQMLINQFGEQVGEPAYDSIAIQPNNTALVKLKSRTDLLNVNGAAVFQTYNDLLPHGAGYLEKTADGDVGLIAKNGKIIFYPHFNYVSGLTNNQFLSVSSADGVGMSLSDGSWMIRPTERFEAIAGSKDGHTAIKINGQWGFVNRYQQLVIANRYDSVRFFHDDLAAIKVNGKWGFLSKRDRIKIQPNYDEVEDFRSERAIVRRGNRYGVLLANGTFLLQLEYEMIKRINDQLFLVEKSGKYGLFGTRGNQVLPVSFEKIDETNDGMIVKRRGKYGVVGLDGQYIIPLKYDLIYQPSQSKYACRIDP